jgi:hypothetical protein
MQPSAAITMSLVSYKKGNNKICLTVYNPPKKILGIFSLPSNAKSDPQIISGNSNLELELANFLQNNGFTAKYVTHHTTDPWDKHEFFA